MQFGNDLFIKIGADASGVKPVLKNVSRDLNKVERQLNHQQRTWKSWSIRSVAATVALGVAIGAVARKTVEYSDALRNVTNRLKITTNSQAELNAITEEMFDLAKQNRSSIEGTVDLYTKLHRSTKELGMSQTELVGITDTIQKAFIVGGASSREMEGAVRQLGQAIAAGALRGEEFNSVSEQAPVIMEAVKVATGKTAGELRKLAAEGAITTEVLIKSLKNYEQYIDTNFAKTTATYAQNIENARTTTIEWVKENEAVQSAVDSAGEAVLYLAENLDYLVKGVQHLAAAYGATLINAIGKTVVAKTAAATASIRNRDAILAEAQATIEKMKVDTAEKANLAQIAAAKARRAEMSLISKAGTNAETEAVARLNLALAAQTKAEDVAKASKAQLLAAEKALNTARNTSTGAIIRQTVAQRALNFVTGNWLTIAALAGYAVYEFVDWESKAEKQLKQTTKEIEDQKGKLEGLSEEAFALSFKQTENDVLDTIDAIRELTKKVEDARKKERDAAGTKGQARAEQKRKELEEQLANEKAFLALMEESLENHLSAKEKMTAKANATKQRIIDLDREAEINSFKKKIEAFEKNNRTELQKAKDKYAELKTGYNEVAQEQIDKNAELVENKKMTEQQAADAEIAIKEKLKKDLIALEQAKEQELAKIRSKDNRTEDQKYFDKLREEAKTEMDIEKEKWKEKQEFLEEMRKNELIGQAEHDQLLEDLKAKHQERMKQLDPYGDVDEYLEGLAERFASEQELLQMKYNKDLEMLQAYIDANKDKNIDFQAWKDKFDAEKAEKSKQITFQENEAKRQITERTAGHIIDAIGAFGKKSLKLQQALSLAQAGVAISTGIARAQELGFPANVAEIARVVAVGAKAIAGIKSAKPANVSGSGRGRAGASTATTGATTSTAQQQNQPDRNITISMQGNSLFSADQVRELIGMINEQVGDGVTINTGG